MSYKQPIKLDEYTQKILIERTSTSSRNEKLLNCKNELDLKSFIIEEYNHTLDYRASFKFLQMFLDDATIKAMFENIKKYKKNGYTELYPDNNPDINNYYQR